VAAGIPIDQMTDESTPILSFEESSSENLNDSGHQVQFDLGKSCIAKGIAFCQLFPPEADPSAYVASKRLAEVSTHYGAEIDWHVIKQDYSEQRNTDPHYDQTYAIRQFSHRKEISVSRLTDFEWWGQRAFDSAIFYQADVMYSRSMMPGSHIAASKYKELYPSVVWYAEFSDPLGFGTNNKPRDSRFFRVEEMVYDKADFIIYTNENQREFMHSYCARRDIDSIRERSIVWAHPVIDREYVGRAQVDYSLDGDMINVAYFGSFYNERGHKELLSILSNPKVVLHIFTPNYYASNYHTINCDIRELGYEPERLRANGSVGNLEMLTIASTMDYLLLADIDFPGAMNPYLPSKYADYLASGTEIIALINSGSPLSKRSDSQLIKVSTNVVEFVKTLKKPIE